MTGLKKLLPFGSPSTKKQTTSSPEQSARRSGTDVQPVDVIDIDPEKLMNRLKLKFGSEFEIHMMHNVYCIKAPGLLTADDIEECR